RGRRPAVEIDLRAPVRGGIIDRHRKIETVAGRDMTADLGARPGWFAVHDVPGPDLVLEVLLSARGVAQSDLGRRVAQVDGGTARQVREAEACQAPHSNR